MAQHHRKKTGLPPGTLVYTGPEIAKGITISVLDYDAKDVFFRANVDVDDCVPFLEKESITWINVDGIHRVDLVERIGKSFKLHPLILEDIVHPRQRPKLEQYGETVYIVLKMLIHDEKRRSISTEQISIVLGRNYLITFQEGRDASMFDEIRAQVRSDAGRFRKMGADYLAYAIVDAIVDHYFVVLDAIGERIEAVQEDLLHNPKDATLKAIHRLNQTMIVLRKAIWPMREAVLAMEHHSAPVITEALHPYLRDLYDHVVRVMETVDTHRELLASMLQIYLSTVSNKLNEVMKVLATISTIFIPLTFLAGVYGMNFKYFPEINWEYGYFFFWFLIALIGLGMFFFFKRKKWF